MTGWTLAEFASLDALPPAPASLLDDVGAAHLFTSRPWFETFVAAGLTPEAAPLFLVLSDATGTARALLPCQRLSAERGVGKPAVASLTSFYSCDFRPVVAPGTDISATAFALGKAVGDWFGGEATVQFDSLDPTQPAVRSFLAGLARPGRALLRYDHFGRWSDSIAGLGFDQYLSQRDGALREVVRRKGRRMERDGASFEIAIADGIEQAVADYEAVYAKSWQASEPFPDFQPTLIRALARAGWLRLAFCRLEGRPVATQLWAVVSGRATVLKLAQDQAFDRYSPGTVLTAFTIRELIARDGIDTLDFGHGDDPYKRAWVGQRTPHIGVLWANPARRPLLVGRHWLAGRLRHALLSRRSARHVTAPDRV